MGKRVVLGLSLVLTSALAVLLISVGFNGQITGFAVYQISGSEFDNGTYNGTEYNGTSIVLSGTNLTGDYISEVINVGGNSTWNNLSWVNYTIVSQNSYLTSAVHTGTNETDFFNLDDTYYLADMKDFSKAVYLNFSENLVDGTVLKIYAKQENGVTVGIYAQSDTVGDFPLGTFTVTSVTGEWYNVTLNITNSTDAIWIGEGTGSGTDPKESFDYIYSYFPGTSLSIEARSCDDDACSGEAWVEINDMLSLGLIENPYFQYKINFVSPSSSSTPSVISVEVDYSLLNVAPEILVDSPQEGATYGYNTSLALDFNVVDSDSNIDSCWYELDAGGVVIISSCANTTFDAEEGSHTLIVYVNDTLGLQDSETINFNVQVGAPTILLNSPINVYLNNSSVLFSYIPSDIDLETCELWGDFTGTFLSNQSDPSPTSGATNTFNLDLNDGTYSWNIWCNDTVGNFAFNGNKTFYVDTTNPVISIVEPSGEKTSRDNILIDISVVDNSPVSCIYNISFETGGDIVTDVNLLDCSSGTFNLSVDGDYVWDIYTVDSAGNSNIKQSLFSVDTSGGSEPVSGDGGSGGSGAGAGGGISFSSPVSEAELEIEPIKSILLKGEQRSLIASVKNVGSVTANKCKLVTNEGFSDYIEANDIVNIGGGEIIELGFILSLLDSRYNSLELSVECLDNISSEVSLELIVLNPEFGVTIEGILFGENNNIEISYNIESTITSSEKFLFSITNDLGEVVGEVEVEVELNEGEIYSGSLSLKVNDGEKGLLTLGITGSDSIKLVEESFIYEGSSPLTGFAARGLGGTTGSILIIILVTLLVGGFIVFKMYKMRK